MARTVTPASDFLLADGRTWKSRGEALLAMLSGSAAEVPAGIAGLASLPMGYDKAAQNVAGVREAMSYQPRDPSSLQALSRGLEPIGSALERLKRGMGDPIADRMGPGAGTAAYMIPDALASLVGAKNMPKGGPTMGQMAENISQPRQLHPQTGAIVWHGSPHKFEKFAANENIGKGEGAQAYGHGGYVAESPEVALGYQKTLSADYLKAGDGELFNPGSLGHLNLRVVMRRDGLDAAIAKAEQIAASGDPTGLAATDLETLRGLKMRGGVAPHDGHLYKMDIPDEAVSRMLDWDKPIMEQPEVMRALAAHPDHASFKAYQSDPEMWADKSDWMTGRGLYSQLDEMYGGRRSVADRSAAPSASKVLADAGIPGIRYLDGLSREGGGTSNFVTFSDDLVRILERNGISTGQQPWKPGEWK